MTQTLTVAVVQPLVVDGDLGANAERHGALVRRTEARVVVFPELSLTGYRLDAEVVDPTEPRLEPLISACRDGGAVALVGAPTTGPTGDHISVLAIDGEGVTVAYHKLYLGGDERDRFRPGPAPAVIDVDGWRLGLAICKDTGVVEHADRTAELGIDGYLAGVCELEADGPIVGERARRVAVDHDVWVGVASFAGSTGHGYDPAAGRSGLWAPGGDPIGEAGPGVDEAVTAAFRR